MASSIFLDYLVLILIVLLVVMALVTTFAFGSILRRLKEKRPDTFDRLGCPNFLSRGKNRREKNAILRTYWFLLTGEHKPLNDLVLNQWVKAATVFCLLDMSLAVLLLTTLSLIPDQSL